MTGSSKRRWHLIRDNIKFQIKLALDAARDLLLSPVAIICTVLDLVKGNNIHQGHFQRLMQWGHNTDHWLNLFGDLPPNTSSPNTVHVVNNTDDGEASTQDNTDDSVVYNQLNVEKTRVDNNLDKLFTKIEVLLEEQLQEGDLTTTAKQKIAHYLAVLNSNHQSDLPKKSAVTENLSSTTSQEPKTEMSKKDIVSKNDS